MLRRGAGRDDRATRNLAHWRQRLADYGFGRSCDRGASEPLRLSEAVTVSIASGKGGTGKSFVASNLAVLAAERGRGEASVPSSAGSSSGDLVRRVGLVDCDFGLACAHLLLGVQPERSLTQVAAGTATIEDVCLETSFGVTLVPGGSGVQHLADMTRQNLAQLGDQLGDFVARKDAVFLDVGAGISRQTLLPVATSDHVILVTQPEIAALTDAYALIKCMASQCRERPFSILVNRVASAGEGDRTFRKLAEVARRFTGLELHYLGEVLEDPAVTRRRLGQHPIVVSDPTCETSITFRRIFDRLNAVLGSLSARHRPPELGFGIRYRAMLEQMF